VPRLINSLCDRALLTGYVSETRLITPDIVEEVAGELPALVSAPLSAATAAQGDLA
jgi:hypothetical protein